MFFFLVRFLLGFRSAVFQRLIIIFAIYKTRRFQRLPSPCWPILVFFPSEDELGILIHELTGFFWRNHPTFYCYVSDYCLITLWWTNSLRTGKCPSLSSVNQLFLWVIFNSYVTNYQRVVHTALPSGHVTNSLLLKMAIEIVDLPSYRMVIFHSYVNLPEGSL